MKTLIVYIPEICIFILLITTIFLWRTVIIKRKIIEVLRICSISNHRSNEFFDKIKKLNLKSFRYIEDEINSSIKLTSYSELCVLIYGGNFSENGLSKKLPPKLGKMFAKIIERKLSLMEDKLFSQIFIESLERQLLTDNNAYADVLIDKAIRSKKNEKGEKFLKDFISVIEDHANNEQNEEKKIVFKGEIIKIQKTMRISVGMSN